MNAYEQKQEQRRNGLEAAAERADERAKAQFRKADLSEEATGIPFGQPILSGHHSEKRHRAVLDRADKVMANGVAETKRAQDLRARAAAVGGGGISSDDPDAIQKLRDKLDSLLQEQRNMKAANSVIRPWHRKGATHETDGADFDLYLAALSEVSPTFANAKIARELLRPQWGHAGPVGFAPYELKNLNARIKNTRNRIESIQRVRSDISDEVQIPGLCTVKEDLEANRIQIRFEGMPSADIRAQVKSHGFRWSPTAGVWQRKITNNAQYANNLLVERLRAMHEA